MKQWVTKLIQQLDVSFASSDSKTPSDSFPQISEDRATLLYMIDVYNKHLFEIEKHSIRKVREKLDNMAKSLVEPNPSAKQLENSLFEIRQFFSSYRIDEYSYIQNTFDDFKRIVWDFADQLSEDIEFENNKDKSLATSLKDLKEAVDANSIETLRLKSRDFINSYVEYQNQKNAIRNRRMDSVKRNLNSIKKQLLEANSSLGVDHLTSAHNRKSFDDYIKKIVQMQALSSENPCSLIMLDIDFFKKINDSYGHDIGDFVLKECVKLLQSVFNKEDMMIARIGGEEFVVVLPQFTASQATQKAEEAMKRIRDEAFIQGELVIRFTVSMGIAELKSNETTSDWLKRADTALYQSKNSGRNKYTLAGLELPKTPKAA